VLLGIYIGISAFGISHSRGCQFRQMETCNEVEKQKQDRRKSAFASLPISFGSI
jgi:hypothetical protein